jgi:hypothetical protein
MTTMDNKQIAETIIQQMGGAGRITAMVGAKDFMYGEGYVTFKFKGSRKMNVVKIQLNSMDLYDVTFMKYSPKNLDCKTVKEFEGIYCDQLKELFENQTGLYLSL